MLLVGKNNAHHLKAQNSKTLEKEGRKECKYPNAPFGVSSITNQPNNQPTNQLLLFCIHLWLEHFTLSHVYYLPSMSFLAFFFTSNSSYQFQGNKRVVIQPGISLISHGHYYFQAFFMHSISHQIHLQLCRKKAFIYISYINQCREIGPMGENLEYYCPLYLTGTSLMLLCIFMHSFSLQNSYSVCARKIGHILNILHISCMLTNCQGIFMPSFSCQIHLQLCREQIRFNLEYHPKCQNCLMMMMMMMMMHTHQNPTSNCA